ncbi:MAG TPA: SDR family NAD(P)-dependent oxidoreductase, partial [bacterium]|nr:SDR family NAD(P)-dependent oxidoreductase [bacterium]
MLVTGAAKRVGRVIALNLAAEGARLIIHYNRSAKDALALQRQIRTKFKTQAETVGADLSQVREVKRLAKEAWKLGSIDVLVNNASTFYPTPLGKVREEQWNDL